MSAIDKRIERLETRLLDTGDEGGEWVDLGDGPPVLVPEGTGARLRMIYGDSRPPPAGES